MRVWPIALAVTCVPAIASAQLGFLDKVFENVTDVAASPVLGRSIRGGGHITDAGDGLALTGMTFEVSVWLGEFFAPKPDKRLCYTEKYEGSPTSREVTTEGNDTTETVTIYNLEKEEKPRFERSDSGRTEFEADSKARSQLEVSKNPKARPRPGKNESQWDRWKRLCAEDPSLGLELAIGYTQLAGYRGRDINLRGAIEELPMLTVYGTLSTGGWVDIYGGLRSGLAQVKGLRAVSDTTVFHGEGSTVQFGLVGPAVVFGNPRGNWGLFVEPAWTFRKFDTIKWADGIPPRALLRGLNFSSFTLALGAQIELGGG